MIKLNDELKFLNKKFEIVKKENEEMKSKINYYEKIINDSIFKHLENIDILKNKIFILENSIIKKDNMIYKINMRLNRYLETDELMDISNPREIYVKIIFK
jgi:predicted RNase H-like nuclease (RuvC/YqgF family)